LRISCPAEQHGAQEAPSSSGEGASQPSRIELNRIHWDILKLIRTLCYDGAPETQTAHVDPHDPRLPQWKPNPHDTRFVLLNGVPEPFVRACLFVLPFDAREQRWGSDGHDPDPVLQYLLDRRLLEVSVSNRAICAAFRNPFGDSEILSTIRTEVNQYGRFFVWDIPFSCSTLLHEHNGSLITAIPYKVLRLSERAHQLLDFEKATSGAEGNRITGPKKADRMRDVWDALSDRQRNCMDALFEFKAFDADSRRSAKEIAEKAEGSGANLKQFKAPLANLVRRNLADRKIGRKGGYWVAGLGREVLVAARSAQDADNGPS